MLIRGQGHDLGLAGLFIREFATAHQSPDPLSSRGMVVRHNCTPISSPRLIRGC